jgi:hypothetical protein
MLKALCAAVLACAFVGACSFHETKTVAAPTGANSTCVDYGFTPGTSGYENCVARETEARRRGRMTREYADTTLASDAQAACVGYGLTPGSDRYERCVRYEISARRYQ